MSTQYYVYAANSANPSKDEAKRVGIHSFDSPKEAWEWIQTHPISYRYVEVTDDNGNLYPKEAYIPSSKVNFLLFGGDNYYPRGGYTDLIAKASTKDELYEIIENNRNKPQYGYDRFDWWQIVDANTHTIVVEGTW